jgi:hypothetical protein
MAGGEQTLISTCTTECWCGPDVSCSGSFCTASEEPGGYVECDGVRYDCADPVVPSVSCSEVSCEMQGKIAYYIVRATASDWCDHYEFEWSGAIQTSPPGANPNQAYSEVILHPSTVTAEVFGSGEQALASCSITLYPGCM